MSNIEELSRDQKQGRFYSTPPKVRDGESNVELELETFTRYLLDKLAKEFAVEPYVASLGTFQSCPE